MLNQWFAIFKNALTFTLVSVGFFISSAQACQWELFMGSTDAPLRVGDTVSLILKGCASATEIIPPENKPGEVPDFLFNGIELKKIQTSGIPFIEVAVLKPGTIEIPEIKLLPTGVTDSFSIKVESVLTDEDRKKPLPPEGFLSATVPWASIFPYLLGAFLVLCLSFYFIYRKLKLLKNRKLILPSIPVTPPLPEDEEILITLKKLENLPASNNYKPLAYGCSDAWKHYISRRFNVDAEEKTADEIYRFLESESPDSALDFQLLMLDLDQVKFTDLPPQAFEVAQWTGRIRDWVLKTRKRNPSEI